MSDSVRPHRWQPTRLPRPWDSPGRNIGVGCHFLLQCMKVRSESEVAQSCPTLRNPMNHSLLGFSIHGIFQARVLKWVANYFSKYRIWGYIKPFEDCFSPNNFSILINLADMDSCFKIIFHWEKKSLDLLTLFMAKSWYFLYFSLEFLNLLVNLFFYHSLHILLVVLYSAFISNNKYYSPGNDQNSQIWLTLLLGTVPAVVP